MTDIPPWITDLGEEKSLWDSFTLARSIPTPRFNRLLRRRGYPLIVSGIAVLVWEVLSVEQSRSAIDSLSNITISVSVTILGFLVAGLAIFSTLSDKRLLMTLAETNQKDMSVSSFKYLYFNLLSTFVVFIGCLVASVIIQVVSKTGIELKSIEFKGITFISSNIYNGVILGFLSIIFCESIVKLKSFIWNLYTSFLSMLFTAYALQEADERADTTVATRR